MRSDGAKPPRGERKRRVQSGGAPQPSAGTPSTAAETGASRTRREAQRIEPAPAGPAQIILSQSDLEKACARWKARGVFAFDTEFVRDDTYFARLGLIQVADLDGVTLIDPTGGIDLVPFWNLLVDPQVEKIAHAPKEDGEVCLSACGNPPRAVFDVQLAAGLVGLGYPLSLSRLVQSITRRTLAKSQTLTDWLRRPLTDEQLHYAAEDVRYLPAVHAELNLRLERAGRSDWAREEFRRYEDAEFYRPPTQDRLFKLKGSKKLDSLGLAVLAELSDWRTRLAQLKNRPARSLVRDDILVELARRRPTRASQIEVLRGFPYARNRAAVEEILAIIARASKTPVDERPAPHEPREESAMDRALLDLLSGLARSVCCAEGVDYELAGGPQRLRDLLDHLADNGDGTPALLSGWRGEFLGRRLADLLKGRCEIHLTGWPDRLALQVVTRVAERG